MSCMALFLLVQDTKLAFRKEGRTGGKSFLPSQIACEAHGDQQQYTDEVV